MAPVAEAPGVFHLDDPDMLFVAVQALKGCLLHMDVVLAHLCLAAVAGAKAVLAINSKLCMWVVAVVASQSAHDALSWYVPVAVQAPLGGYEVPLF